MGQIPEKIQNRIEEIRHKCSMLKPKVVIHSLAYNHGPYIKDALDGFIKQKTNFAIIAIVHDDASTDNTAAILKEYAEKYPDIILPIFETKNQYSKPDGSLGDIMNAAIEATGAEYIAMCECDDYWTDPLKLQKQVDFLEANSEYGLIYTQMRPLMQKKNTFFNAQGGPSERLQDLMKINTIPTLTVVIRRNLWKLNFNDINSTKNNWMLGDYPLWLYAAGKSKIKFLNEVTGVYRILSESASHSSNYLKKLLFKKSCFDISTDFGKHFNISIPNCNLIMHAMLEIQIAVLKRQKVNRQLMTRIRDLCKKDNIRLITRIQAIILYFSPHVSTYIIKAVRQYLLKN